MRVLFLGDIVGSCGRDAVLASVPGLRAELGPDYVIANGENVAGGKGITPKIADELLAGGVDIISGGNHTFQHREVYPYLDSGKPIARPHNYPPGAPGTGVVQVGNLVLVNLIGRTFMGTAYDDPFRAADEVLRSIAPGTVVVVDIHAEATSEKQALGWYLDGRVSAVIGTHTHVPTADCRVLPQGTAYCTDAGMCGARDSVIGDRVESVIARFLTQMPTRLHTADGPAVINGVMVDIDDGSARACSIERVDRTLC